jgi:hypothetical protein
MASDIATAVYTCDWRDEHKAVCGDTGEFAGKAHETEARKAGWGAYANADIRWNNWEAGGRLWFCPTHATVFGNNHGWGNLEDYRAPIKPVPDPWWKRYF